MKNWPRPAVATNPPRARHVARVCALLLMTAAAACTSSPNVASNGSTPTTLTIAANPVGLTPNYIFPVVPAQDYALQNLTNLTYMLFRPLYWYGTDYGTSLNTAFSLAYPPTYNPSDTAVTIHLKKLDWSDGTPVTARDIQFWQNIVAAGKGGWAAYVKKDYPDNVSGTTIIDPSTIQLRLSAPVNPTWFTYNELSQITPLPQHVMDRTSLSGSVGNYDLTPSGAAAVYKFLSTQGADLKTFATNPLWRVVDGPWKLTSFSLTGQATFSRNLRYFGPANRTLKTLVEVPFASTTAVNNALFTGAVDFAGLTTPQVPLESRFKAAGYTTTTVGFYGIGGLIPNEHSPNHGALFRQTYFRQVMELLVDQQTIISKLEYGNGQQSCGPVPLTPPSKFVSPLEKQCPLQYAPGKAAQTLRAHGWSVQPGGTSVCIRGGPTGCGSGVATGTRANFNLIYPAQEGLDSTMLLLKTDAAKIGIAYNIKSVPFATDFSTVAPCQAGTSACSWDIGWFAWVYQPDYLPTGDVLFSSTGGSNVANYSDPTADHLTDVTLHSSSLSDFFAYENYIALQAPWIWLPEGNAIYEVKNNVAGAIPPFNPFIFDHFETWGFKR